MRLKLAAKELFNERDGTFIQIPACTIEFEHSLLAVSKWESKYQKAFLDQTSGTKTEEQIKYYIKCMITSEPPSDEILEHMSVDELTTINKHIESKESATTFGDMPKSPGGKSEIITSELVYYWMVAFTIPFECETWNLNRLFALIRICNIKNSPQKKMPRHSVASRNREINAARRAQYGTSG